LSTSKRITIKPERNDKRVTKENPDNKQQEYRKEQQQQESRESEAIEGGALGLFNCLRRQPS
jgi:hypothetical protein